MNGVLLRPQRALSLRGDKVGRQRLYVVATATPQNKGNKGGRSSKTGGTPRTPTGPTVSTPSTSQPSSNTRANVESAEAQVKATTDSAARQTEARVDDTADAAKDAAQDTKRQSRQAAAETKRNISGASEDVKEGVDQAADVVADTAESAQQGIDDASEQLQEGIDQGAAQLQRAADRAPDVAADLVQQGVDTVSEGIEQAQDLIEEAQQPGPAAPYSTQRLTVLDSASFEGRPGPKAEEDAQVKYYKQLLIYCVAGLDRGSAANEAAASEVEIAVSRLQSATSPVVLSWTSEEGKASTTLAQLNGTWRLVYSSAFQQGGLGNSGLPTFVSPFQLGQVYQTISAYTSRLDNVVELYSKLPVPSLPGFSRSEPVITTATLRHAFEPIGGSTSQITFEDTEIKTTGGIGGLLGRLPEVSLPQLPRNLRPSREQRTSTFETLYLDDDLRVTRGRRGELRVFVKT